MFFRGDRSRPTGLVTSDVGFDFKTTIKEMAGGRAGTAELHLVDRTGIAATDDGSFYGAGRTGRDKVGIGEEDEGAAAGAGGCCG